MDGKPNLQLVKTGRGLTVHLHDATDQSEPAVALCGRPARFPELSTWFVLNGCMTCARRAVHLGYTSIVDVDGEHVALDNFVNVGHLP
jgi:hypothetical protein